MRTEGEGNDEGQVVLKSNVVNEEEEEEEDTCGICHAEYEEGDQLKVLPCTHFFHKRCVDEWLQRTPACPQCKMEVKPAMVEFSM